MALRRKGRLQYGSHVLLFGLFSDRTFQPGAVWELGEGFGFEVLGDRRPSCPFLGAWRVAVRGFGGDALAQNTGGGVFFWREALRLVVVDAVMLTRGCHVLPWLRSGDFVVYPVTFAGLVGCNVPLTLCWACLSVCLPTCVVCCRGLCTSPDQGGRILPPCVYIAC